MNERPRGFSQEESPKHSEQETPKNIESKTDAKLESLLVMNAERLNEGSNGVILRLNFDQIPPELVAELKAAEITLGSDQVTKILKIYRPGTAIHEFEMQKKAYDIVTEAIENGKGKSPLAKVPRPHFVHDVTLSEEGRKKLEEKCVKFHPGERIELLFMDEVKGVDIATVLYTEVIKRHPKTRHLIRDMECMTFEDLRDETSRAIGFSLPGGKGKTDSEREFERERVENQNMEMLFSWLEKDGYVVKKSAVDAIANTIDLLHQNGMVFKDAHHRNFMVAGDMAAGAPQEAAMYVIDFGSASEFKGDYQKEKSTLFVDEAEGQRYPDDYMTANTLRRFVTPAKERQDPADAKFLIEMERTMSTLEKRGGSDVSAFIEHLETTVKKGIESPDAAYIQLASSPARTKIDYLLAPLRKKVRDGTIDADEAKKFLTNLATKTSIDYTNRIRTFIRLI